MSSALDGCSLPCLSSTVCHHRVAQMSKTERTTQGPQQGDEKRLLGVCFTTTIRPFMPCRRESLNVFNFSNHIQMKNVQ